MAKSAVAKVEKTEPAAEQPEAKPSARETPALRGPEIQLDSEGYLTRRFIVRLTPEVTLQDLADPRLWRITQRHPQRSFRPLDELLIVAADESWIVRAIVTAADGNSATIAFKPNDVIRSQGRGASWEDDKHRIEWRSTGYAAVRKLDGVQVLPQLYSSVDSCKLVLFKTHYTAGRAA